MASGEVRGGAPGSREWALLDPGRAVDAVDAVVLTGGSAFGLAACDGVMAWCEEQGRGWPAPAGPVPIVVGLVLYDLTTGDPSARPGRAEGYQACREASAEPVPSGLLGAGTGATIGKWRGPAATRPGGLGSASVADGERIVAALVAVNAIGDIRPVTARPVPLMPWPSPPAGSAGTGTNTTIGVVVTNGQLTKLDCRRVAAGAHNGLAAPSNRSTSPATVTPSWLQPPGSSPRRSTRWRRWPPGPWRRPSGPRCPAPDIMGADPARFRDEPRG